MEELKKNSLDVVVVLRFFSWGREDLLLFFIPTSFQKFLGLVARLSNVVSRYCLYFQSMVLLLSLLASLYLFQSISDWLGLAFFQAASSCTSLFPEKLVIFNRKFTVQYTIV